MRDLLAAGLIVRLPDVGNRTYYQRAESKVWEWIEELATRQRSAPESQP